MPTSSIIFAVKEPRICKRITENSFGKSPNNTLMSESNSRALGRERAYSFFYPREDHKLEELNYPVRLLKCNSNTA